MASLPVQPPVTARVDPSGRLVSADPALLALQEAAGGRLGTELAVPQLAAVARLAGRLGVPIERQVLAANDSEDLELWLLAKPDREGVTLSVERWLARPPSRSRWSGRAGGEGEEAASDTDRLLTDSELRIVELSPGLARRLRLGEGAVGQPLARLLRPVEDSSGNLPLLSALGSRGSFTAQPALLRGSDEPLLLDGQPREEDGRFAGYVVRVRIPSDAAPLAALPLDDLLKEPLASIIGQAEEIAGRSEGPLRSDYAGYGTDIAAAARHLLDLLAAISREASPDGSAPEGETIDLAELVLDAAGLVQPQAAERGIVLDIGGEGRLAALGQGRAICQILVNLIANAVRFSPAQGSVSITLERGAQASVTVSDLGPGVAPADRTRIFERFEQAGTKAGSAGLGLAISRRLAREMGGEVALLESSTGAVFRLSLPSA
ncbi:hypothetical protein GCM10022280_19730 [Sphingomonas swuensis]|uniref:histidine kinase n=1 Tax=Sphingomonas swuensis TaxID=977800 RepID=A0ABP7T1N3_9SPHN